MQTVRSCLTAVVVRTGRRHAGAFHHSSHQQGQGQRCHIPTFRRRPPLCQRATSRRKLFGQRKVEQPRLTSPTTLHCRGRQRLLAPSPRPCRCPLLPLSVCTRTTAKLYWCHAARRLCSPSPPSPGTQPPWTLETRKRRALRP